jgi:WD domain, G-beta repeat
MDAAPVDEPPQPAGGSVNQHAHASGNAEVNQAGRDLHLHYEDGVRRAKTPDPVGVCPYPGLASFGPGEARWFFGRDELTADLITRLDQRLTTGGIQIVVAPSGAGKSSLLHAGLLPKLADGALDGSADWPVLTLTPTATPLTALAAHVAELNGSNLATDPPALLAALRDRMGDERVVVVVDQFEELFTLCTDDQQRRAFIELLHDMAEAGVLVVLGVRADFYAACANYPVLRAALQDRQLVVGPMSEDELRQAIRNPAKAVGLDVEAGLVELLLRDLGDTGTTGYAPGRLPLLAHALRTTWQQRHGHTLTVQGYQTTGGIHKAVATTAEDVYTDLDKTGQQMARTLFLRLVKIGDAGADTRRRIPRNELLQGLDIDVASPVLNAFTHHRLLTQDQDTVEITHEALLTAWPRLTEWIGNDRTGNLIRQNPTHPTPLGTPLTGHTDYVLAVAFSPDGHTLATGSEDRTVRLWDLDVSHAIRRICATTANNLTPVAWRQYVSPDLPYQPPCP